MFFFHVDRGACVGVDVDFHHLLLCRDDLNFPPRRPGRHVGFHIKDHKAKLYGESHRRHPTSTIDDLQWTTFPFATVFLPLGLSTPRPLVHRPPDGHRTYHNDERP